MEELDEVYFGPGLAWIGVCFGAWLVWTGVLLYLPYTPALPVPMWVNFLTGLAVVVVSLLALRRPRLSLVNVILGLWLMASPFLLGFMGSVPMLVHNLVVGALVALVGWSDLNAGREVIFRI